ncbi:MAG: NTP transferase domain-containing protein [Acidimicrobiales bacterium]
MAPPLVVLAAGMARRYGGCKPLAPIGPEGDAVIDLLASDAVAAGFGQIVLVLHPETGPAIRYHVERCWPDWVDVRYAEQRLPLGTVHAVLAAQSVLDADRPFGVCNADDVYGEEAMRLLSRQLVSDDDEHVLVGYELRSTVTTDDPVTRGVCEVDGEGYLVSLTERRQVTRHDGGATFSSEDGLEPKTLAGDLPASVNLWGFRPGIWKVFETAMEGSGLDEEALLARVVAGDNVPKAEVLLPEVVATMAADKVGLPVRVVGTEARLLGVTHAADLPVVSAELARQVAWGTRPATLWGEVD